MKILDYKQNEINLGDTIRIHSLRNFDKCSRMLKVIRNKEKTAIGVQGATGFTKIANLPSRALEKVLDAKSDK